MAGQFSPEFPDMMAVSCLKDGGHCVLKDPTSTDATWEGTSEWTARHSDSPWPLAPGPHLLSPLPYPPQTSQPASFPSSRAQPQHKAKVSSFHCRGPRQNPWSLLPILPPLSCPLPAVEILALPQATALCLCFPGVLTDWCGPCCVSQGFLLNCTPSHPEVRPKAVSS